ncbi:MAG TPA: fasciclin domain-containing protein [Methylomirabilota bacterium]|nr:fasciclin domain-containing protein [Methylomirabilota bacterium]
MKMKLFSGLGMVAALVAVLNFAPTNLQAGTEPKASEDIVAVAAGNENFKTLVAAVKAAGLVETLQGKGPFTVFAPTDAAFAKLPKGTVEDLLKPENKSKLVSILTYHVVPGKVMAADVKTMEAKTVQGQKVSLKVSDSGVTIDDAKIVKTDIPAKNGVIHVIDTVIIPKS